MVVVSIYVNPTQFGLSEDLSRYPRDFARDKKLCQSAGVDVIFAPDDRDMYPGKARAITALMSLRNRLSRGMEGVSRPTHFRGVTTVVAKLVQPGASGCRCLWRQGFSTGSRHPAHGATT